jgi:ABC-type molybdate transport system substrate-binding protein
VPVKISQRNPLILLLALFALIPLSACGGDSSGGPGGQRDAPNAITVLADSSLKTAFTRLGHQFESQNPGTTVTFTFGASSALAKQAVAGDPGDVLSTADQQSMNSAESVQLSQLQTFATKGQAIYQIVTLDQSKNTSLSGQFITLVTGPSGQKVLTQAGFGPP